MVQKPEWLPRCAVRSWRFWIKILVSSNKSYHIALRMENQMRSLLIGLAATTISLLPSSTNATETFVPAYGSVHHHERWHVRRIGPQSCFLMPDVAVALNALGPYCSSPRGSYGVAGSYYGRYWPYAYYVPYYGFYRPWGWSDIGRPWGW
jgi:hypothetical protein